MEIGIRQNIENPNRVSGRKKVTKHKSAAYRKIAQQKKIIIARLERNMNLYKRRCSRIKNSQK